MWDAARSTGVDHRLERYFAGGAGLPFRILDDAAIRQRARQHDQGIHAMTPRLLQPRPVDLSTGPLLGKFSVVRGWRFCRALRGLVLAY